MRKPFAYGVGGVLSADIAVPDHARELAFYSTVLTSGDAPLWRDDLSNNQGTPIIGLGARTPEYDALPLQWMPHFQVADVAASAARALELGGEELMHSKGDDGQSQWAVLVDQVGAAFGLIPVVPTEADSANEADRVGCISWLTLAVPDASSSRDFYQQVIGWDAKSIETEVGDGRLVNFEMQRANDIPAATICHSRGDYEGVPPVWLISLPVDDMPESLRRVREGGGKVINVGAEEDYAVIQDPVGVYMALQAG